jgi:outer membrane protein TolC
MCSLLSEVNLSRKIDRLQRPLMWVLPAFSIIYAFLLAPTAVLQAQLIGKQSVLPDYSKSGKTFPNVIKRYEEQSVPPLVLENSPRLRELIRDGKLELSMSDALALTLENNLGIAVQRYLRPIAQVDILRAESGQAARGIPGALFPSGLSVGALGVGVNQFQGAGGVGSAGGISGGGGAVQVPQEGAFDPVISLNSSWDRTVAPLNTLQVAGVPRVTTYSTAFTGTYTQMLPDGSSFLVTLNGIRQSSTQQFLLYNPAVISRFAMGFNQPLLNGFGLLPNKRFLMIAQNDVRTSEEVFRQQVTTTVVQMEEAYWQLAALRQAIIAVQRVRDAAQTLYRQTQVREQFGTASKLDVVSAQADLAAAQRDLVIVQTNYQLQETQFRGVLSKSEDPEFAGAEIIPTDQLPEPNELDVPDLQTALETAKRERPELQISEQDLRNQNVTAQFTKNGLLPGVNLFGLYAGAGLAGNTRLLTAGAGTSLYQDVAAAYPEYAGGLSLSLPIRNRSSQADNLRARLEERQLQVNLQAFRQQVDLEVRQAVTGLEQGKAQVEAAHQALLLANETAEAERQKLAVGASTVYNVILRERDATTAAQAEIATVSAYANALVEMDRVTGTTLEHNNIQLSDALSGEISTRPRPFYRYPRYPGVVSTPDR